MKQILLLIATAIVLSSCSCHNPSQVAALLDRIGGEGTSERIETSVNKSLSENGKDVFVISTKKGKPYIKGSSVSDLTTGI